MAKITALPGETEHVGLRTMCAKVFRTPDGRIRSVTKAAPVHWQDGANWVDVDDTPTSADGRIWTVPSVPYDLTWDAEALTMTYQSKRGGDVTIRLMALDGLPVGKPGAAQLIGQRIRCTVAPQLDIDLMVRPFGIEIFKILRGPAAPTAMQWEVLEGDMRNISMRLLDTKGWDNLDRAQSRMTQQQFNRFRQVELIHIKSAEQDVGGRKLYTVTEEFTGRTRFIDPTTRARTWVDEVQYPVQLDVTVSETISADADDGSGVGGTWYAGYCILSGYAGNEKYPAFRFQTVALPQGQTLDSALLSFSTSSRGGAGNSVMRGQANDNASSWANGSANSPAAMVSTVASTVVSLPPLGSSSVNVLTSVQEIINRVGWASNNNMRLGFTNVSGMAASYATIVDYAASAANAADLTVVYTPAAAGGLQKFMAGDLSGIGAPGRFFQDPLQKVAELIGFYHPRPA